jgi:hypothetical protein
MSDSELALKITLESYNKKFQGGNKKKSIKNLMIILIQKSHFQRYQSIKELRCPKNGQCTIYGFRGKKCHKCRLDK